MGIYNPNAPQILGQEWVPIRDTDVTFAPAVNSVERGYSYTLTANRRIRDARFYLKDFPNPVATQQVAVFNTYPIGREALSGPIKQVVIPVSFASITGFGGTPWNIIGASTITDALFRPDDSGYVGFFHINSVFSRFSLFFDVPSFPQLAGKRILNVSLDYSGTAADTDNTSTGDGQIHPAPVPLIVPEPNSPLTQVDLFRFSTSVTYGGPGAWGNLGALSGLSPPVPAPIGSTTTGAQIASLDLGDVNPLWTASPGDDVMPWRYDDLLFFNQAAGVNRYTTRVLVQIPITAYLSGQGGQVNLYYFALRVTYCEENRVMYGGKFLKYQGNTNVITQRDLTQTADPVLTTGDYTTTLAFVSPGERSLFSLVTGNNPTVNGLREIDAMPQPGVEVDIPFPLDKGLGSQFAKESTHIIPQLSLHTSGGVLTEIHPYGRQSQGQVFGIQTVTQEILDGAAGGPFQYPQVRFYARRFGNTTVPLTLTGSQPGGLFLPGSSGSYASTPDNAALDITGDIDLRVDLSAANWTLGTEQTLLSKWTNTGPQFSYLFSIAAGTGNLVLGWSATGAAALFAVSTAAPVPGPNGRLAVRVTLDVDNGAAGRTVTFYTAPTINDTFVQLGAPVTTAGVTSIFNSTAPVEIGSQTGGTTNLLNGVVYSAEIRNLIGGTLVASPFFSGQAPGTTSFTDAQGRVWTVNGTATIIGGTLGNTVSITPAQFDALDEVLDGWKQVDLRFASTPTMGAGTNPRWTWTAAGELPGNRWEVMGAVAPAVSGSAGATFNLAAQQLSAATYGQPSAGATVNESWLTQAGPYVSGATDDATADATLIFSQDMPTVSGFVVSGAAQTLTGVGLNCSAYPWYVPSAISYNQLTWTPVAGLILDTFSTPAVSGWSPADSGQTWTVTDGSTSRFSVSGGTGNISIATLNANHAIDVNLGTSNQDITTFVTLPALVAGGGGSVIFDLRIRKFDSSNYYYGHMVFFTGGVIDANLNKTVAATPTVIGQAPSLTQVDGHTYGMRVSAIGSLIQMKVWDATISPEPLWWQVSVVDTGVPTGNSASVFNFANSSVTNTLPFVISYDNLSSSISTFGYYELQRMDTLTDWQTIAQVSSPFVSGFRDYEARVGLLSSYRIREVNSLLFAGQWSSTGTLTMAAPGLTGTGMTGTPYVLIFTSNARQNGSRSLAYALAYDGTPTEQFGFPEAGFTQYQFMYNRDFQVAFRPLERGGETFSRTVLVQAAAISPETLADFKSLRDMAWDTLPYVCVRDQDGNRWFANVTVPTGRVQHKRQLYLADINVVEVTETSAVTVI